MVRAKQMAAAHPSAFRQGEVHQQRSQTSTGAKWPRPLAELPRAGRLPGNRDTTRRHGTAAALKFWMQLRRDADSFSAPWRPSMAPRLRLPRFRPAPQLRTEPLAKSVPFRRRTNFHVQVALIPGVWAAAMPFPRCRTFFLQSLPKRRNRNRLHHQGSATARRGVAVDVSQQPGGQNHSHVGRLWAGRGNDVPIHHRQVGWIIVLRSLGGRAAWPPYPSA